MTHALAPALTAVTAAVTDFTRDAQRLLRDPDQFKWYTVTLLAFVLYAYSVEVERRRWDIIFAGIAFWLFDWFNEIVNALVLHFSHRAALWTVTGSTSYLILIGLTIEISFLFAVSGIVLRQVAPAGPAHADPRHPEPARARARLLVLLRVRRVSCCTGPASSTGTTGGGTSRSCR